MEYDKIEEAKRLIRLRKDSVTQIVDGLHFDNAQFFLRQLSG